MVACGRCMNIHHDTIPNLILLMRRSQEEPYILNPLNSQLFSLQTTYTRYLHFCPSYEPKTEPKSKLVTLTMLTHQRACTNQHSRFRYTTQSPSSLPWQKPILYKVRVEFSKPVHVVRVGGGSPDSNYGSSTATIFMSPCRWHYSSPTVPPILLTQNLSASTWRPSFWSVRGVTEPKVNYRV